jgi:hypothetical protein
VLFANPTGAGAPRAGIRRRGHACGRISSRSRCAGGTSNCLIATLRAAASSGASTMPRKRAFEPNRRTSQVMSLGRWPLVRGRSADLRATTPPTYSAVWLHANRYCYCCAQPQNVAAGLPHAAIAACWQKFGDGPIIDVRGQLTSKEEEPHGRQVLAPEAPSPTAKVAPQIKAEETEKELAADFTLEAAAQYRTGQL